MRTYTEDSGLKNYKQYFISDPHFGHKNILSFKDDNGDYIRHFYSIEEMHETIIENWNNRVRPQDRVYVLGDVVIHKKALPIVEKLKGHKILVAGNHDIFGAKEYLKYFEDVRAYKVMPGLGLIFSHVPVHPNNLRGRWNGNVIGHLHQREYDDKRYMNVCVERINYTPILLEEIVEEYKKRGIDL